MRPCTICDIGKLARTDPDAAVTLALFLGCADPDLAAFKRNMCDTHRGNYAMMLLRGGVALDAIGGESA